MQLKGRLVLLIFLLLPVVVHAQLDDLKRRLQLAQQRGVSDTQTVNLLNRIAETYMLETATDSSLAYADRALFLARTIKYHEGKADAISGKSKCYYKTGDYDKSVELALASLKICDSVNYSGGKAVNYNLLALVYLSQKNYAASGELFLRAVAINEQAGNLYRLCSNCFNLALLHAESGNADSAVYWLNRAAVISEQSNNRHMQVMIANRLGEIYYQQDSITKAVRQFQQVIDDTSAGIDWERSFAFSGIAMCYLQEGKPEEAARNAEKGVAIARMLKTKWDIGRGLAVLHEAYAGMGKYDMAYNTLAEQKLYNDSLFDEAKEGEINALHLQREKAERLELQRRNELAVQKNALNRMVLLVIILVALFLLVLVIISFRNNRRKNALNEMLMKNSADISRQNKLIEAQNKELAEANHTKDQLFSIIGHDLRSPFSSIIAGLDVLRQSDLDKDEVQFLFDKLHEQTVATSAMVDNLLLWARSQIGGTVVRPSVVYMPGVVDDVLSVLKSSITEKDISLRHNSDTAVFVMVDPDHLKIILQNLLTNAVKFTENGGSIAITYTVSRTQVSAHISDTGVGIPAHKLEALFARVGKDISTPGTNSEKGTGLGLVLVKKFVDENQGTISVTSTPGSGTEFVITFPRAQI